MRILVVGKNNIMKGPQYIYKGLAKKYKAKLFLWNASLGYKLLKIFGRKAQYAYASFLFKRKLHQHFDIVLLVSVFFVPDAFFEILKQYPKVKKVGWTWDAFSKSEQKKIDVLDILFCSDTGFMETGGKKSQFLPLFADETVFQNKHLKRTGLPFFVGVSNLHRSLYFEGCTQKCAIYGKGWDLKKLKQHDVHNQLLSHKEVQDFIHTTKVPLNIAFSSNNRRGLNFRVFEIATTGGLIMINDEASDLSLCYKKGLEAITYTTVEDFNRLVSDIITHPDKYEKIALAGYERTMREHTLTHRLEQMMRMIQKN